MNRKNYISKRGLSAWIQLLSVVAVVGMAVLDGDFLVAVLLILVFMQGMTFWITSEAYSQES